MKENICNHQGSALLRRLTISVRQKTAVDWLLAAAWLYLKDVSHVHLTGAIKTCTKDKWDEILRLTYRALEEDCTIYYDHDEAMKAVIGTLNAAFNSRPFARNASKTFRPAFDYLSNNLRSVQLPTTSKHSTTATHRRKTTNDSIDDYDIDSDLENNNYNHNPTMDRRSHSRHGSQEAGASLAAPVPLIDIGSRSASPSYPRSRSAAQSEDEDDEYDYEGSSSIRPLVGGSSSRYEHGTSFKMVLRQGGLGKWLFGTWAGWQVWVGLLVFWTGGCGFGLLLMNRFIMLTGVYKFPFPLTGTYVQLVLTHVLLIGFSSLTRGLASPLRRLGLGAAIAPAIPVAPQGGAFRNASTKKTGSARFLTWLSNGSGGIAGGGLFEFDYNTAKQVLPLAIIFVVKVLLSNFSFAYAPLPVYQLARIGVTPLSLLFSCVLQKDSISAPVLSAALIATLNLLFATLRSNVRVTWESIVAGVFSSVFAALYPILLLRTYRTLLATLAPQNDVLTGYPTRSEDDNRDETRAYYRTLHYTSLLSIALLTPIVLLSGEPRNIAHNIPFLDVPFFWLMIWCGAIGSWAVFSSTLVLVKATSPLTATFVNPSTQASEHIDRTRGTVLALPRMAAEYELEQVAADAMAAEALFNNAARRYDLTVKKWQILTKLHVEEKIKEAKEEDEKL
ncbi:hypothetical protein SLS61_003605 [Didymella pomorum]